jgi:hypothetical protein
MAINKVRGDRFLAACTLENRGDTDLGVNVKIIAFSGERTLELGSFTDVLEKGRQRDIQKAIMQERQFLLIGP